MTCEIVGLATLSARLDPEDLREVVAAYHGCIRDVVEQQNGFVAKFLPEGALVCFGYPQAGEERLAKLEALFRPSRIGLSETIPLFAPLLSIPLGERYTPTSNHRSRPRPFPGAR